jgi:hypothetical protein
MDYRIQSLRLYYTVTVVTLNISTVVMLGVSWCQFNPYPANMENIGELLMPANGRWDFNRCLKG